MKRNRSPARDQDPPTHKIPGGGNVTERGGREKVQGEAENRYATLERGRRKDL